MLSWLDRFWHGLTGYVTQPVADAVHWAMHALASVVFSVFRLVGRAWDLLLAGIVATEHALGDFARACWQEFGYIIHVAIPALTRWAEAQLARLGAGLLTLERWAARELARLSLRLDAAIASLWQLVIRNVFNPLRSIIAQVAADLRKWGYTAWWYVTHPDALAEVLVGSIAVSLEKHALELAPGLGRFLLALIRSHLRQLITVIEDVLTAVL